MLFGNFETREKGSFDKKDDPCPFVYKSSVVEEGSGLAIVVAVGNHTQERREINFKKCHGISTNDLTDFEKDKIQLIGKFMTCISYIFSFCFLIGILVRLIMNITLVHHETPDIIMDFMDISLSVFCILIISTPNKIIHNTKDRIGNEIYDYFT